MQRQAPHPAAGTLGAFLPLLREALRPHYDPREVQAIAELLVEEICGWTRLDYLLKRGAPLPPDRQAALQSAAAQLAQGLPVQYVLGFVHFCDLRLQVTPATLIPRPETEELVRWVAEDAVADRPLTLLDVGTGSGCIALALARLINTCRVVGIDISTDALAVAQANANRLSLSNITFAIMDILSPFGAPNTQGYPPLSTPDSLPVDKFDIIVSNPPYVRHSEAADMHSRVLDHEPHAALFVPDNDPLVFYRAIARYGQQHLLAGGRIYVEINAALGSETLTLFRHEGYPAVELRQDVSGRPRMLRAALD